MRNLGIIIFVAVAQKKLGAVLPFTCDTDTPLSPRALPKDINMADEVYDGAIGIDLGMRLTRANLVGPDR